MHSDELIVDAYLGDQAERFFKSDIGKEVLSRIEEEEQEALEKLATTSSWRKRKITQLQNEIWRCRSVKRWFSDLIIQGQMAINTLENEE